MMRSLFGLAVIGAGLVCSACGSSSDPSSASSAGESGNSGGSGSASCPDVSGSWKITAHCDRTVVGLTLQVTQRECSLAFAEPFDAFSGSLTSDGKIALSGPQTCTGTATASSVSMNCTPDPCPVQLAR
jgi:hypothetical protein